MSVWLPRSVRGRSFLFRPRWKTNYRSMRHLCIISVYTYRALGKVTLLADEQWTVCPGSHGRLQSNGVCCEVRTIFDIFSGQESLITIIHWDVIYCPIIAQQVERKERFSINLDLREPWLVVGVGVGCTYVLAVIRWQGRLLMRRALHQVWRLAVRHSSALYAESKRRRESPWNISQSLCGLIFSLFWHENIQIFW